MTVGRWSPLRFYASSESDGGGIAVMVFQDGHVAVGTEATWFGSSERSVFEP